MASFVASFDLLGHEAMGYRDRGYSVRVHKMEVPEAIEVAVGGVVIAFDSLLYFR